MQKTFKLSKIKLNTFVPKKNKKRKKEKYGVVIINNTPQYSYKVQKRGEKVQWFIVVVECSRRRKCTEAPFTLLKPN